MAVAFAGRDDEWKFSWRTALIGLALAIVASEIVTIIAFYIVDAIGLLPDRVTIERMNGDIGAIGAGDVFGSVLFDWIIGGIVFLLLRQFTRHPLRLFLLIAAVVTVLSFFLPWIQIDDIPFKMVIGLDILHVVAAVAGVGVLYKYIQSQSHQ